MRQAAGVWIEKNGKVLAVRCTHRPGWSLPCGKVDPGEEAQEAAVREAKEEIGVDVALADAAFMAVVGEVLVSVFRAEIVAGQTPSIVDPTEIAEIEYIDPRIWWVDPEAETLESRNIREYNKRATTKLWSAT